MLCVMLYYMLYDVVFILYTISSQAHADRRERLRRKLARLPGNQDWLIRTVRAADTVVLRLSYFVCVLIVTILLLLLLLLLLQLLRIITYYYHYCYYC